MNYHKLLFLIVSFFLGTELLFARQLDNAEKIEQNILEISRDMGDYFVRVADRIDSIEATLSDRELETCKYYFNYTDAYVAYMKGDYDKTLRLVDVALEHFMYNRQNEWAAQCLLLIGNTAATRRLIPEAINAYFFAIKLSNDERTLARAYLNMARNRKSLHLEWREHLKLGTKYSIQSGSDHLILSSRMVSYWLTPDSLNICVEVPLIANQFNRLELYSKEADAYKCLVFHYMTLGEFDKALEYANLSIEAYNQESRSPKVLLASMYFLKGKVLLLKKEREAAYEEYNKALALNKAAQCKENNYNLYKSMYRYEYEDGNYQEACFFLEQAIWSYKILSDRRVFYFVKMSKIFQKIKVIEKELSELRRQARLRIILVAVFLIAFFTAIIIWLRSRKRHYEKISAVMEDKNLKLKEETGELLLKANQHQLKSKIIEHQSEFEYKLERYLLKNKSLPTEVKEKYAETLLCIDSKLPLLSDTEKRYAAMIVLGTPIKMIAELFNVKTETVAHYRNRIRKKLGIVNTEIELVIYLKTFIDE